MKEPKEFKARSHFSVANQLRRGFVFKLELGPKKWFISWNSYFNLFTYKISYIPPGYDLKGMLEARSYSFVFQEVELKTFKIMAKQVQLLGPYSEFSSFLKGDTHKYL